MKTGTLIASGGNAIPDGSPVLFDGFAVNLELEDNETVASIASPGELAEIAFTGTTGKTFTAGGDNTSTYSPAPSISVAAGSLRSAPASWPSRAGPSSTRSAP